MKWKRFLAAFLSIAMIVTMLPVVSYAHLVDADKKGKVRLVLLKEDEDAESGPKFTPITTADIDKTAGSTFYVGVYTEDFENLYAVANYEEATTGNSSKATAFGLNNISFGVSYNADIIELEPDLVDDGGYDPEAAIDLITERITYANTDNLVSLVNKFGKLKTQRAYTVFDSNLMNINSTVSEEDQANNFSARVVVSAENGNTNISFPWSGKESTYVGILKFRFKEDADDLTPGTKLLGFSHSMAEESLNTLAFGSSEAGVDTAVKYEDNGDDTYGTYTEMDLQDIRNVLEFIDPVLYPISYKVKFYDSYDASTKKYGDEIKDSDKTFGATGVEEDTAIDNAGITVPVAGTDFPATKEIEGKTKYFAGFKYIDSEGNEKSYDDLTTIGASAVDGDDYTIKVYPDYADPYTVTFHSNYNNDYVDGTSDKTASAVVNPDGNTSASVPTDVNDWSKSGYAITGWKTSDGSDFTPGTTAVTADTDVYAVWTEMYTVTFKQQESDTNAIKTLEFNPQADSTARTIKASDLPTEEQRGTIANKRFDAWYYKVGTSGTETKFEDTTSLEVTDNVVIYGKWVDVVTVKFYDSKDAADPSKTWTVDKGTKVSGLTSDQEIPTINDNDTTHKYFAGWKNKTDDAAVSFTNDYEFTSDLSVYADFGDYYQIKYYSDVKDNNPSQFGETFYINPHSNSNSPVVGSENIPTNSPTTTDENKAFDKWVYYNNDTETDFTATTSVTGNIDVYPKWSDLISIKFDYNGGTVGSDQNSTLKIKPNTSITDSTNGSLTAPTPTKSYNGHNYVLQGWAATANAQTPAYTTATIDTTAFAAGTTLYAVWAVDPSTSADQLATLKFDSAGGSSVSDITVYKGDTITADQMPADPTKTSSTGNAYTFGGWYEDASPSSTATVTAPIVMSEDKTAYAHWSYDASDKITITFNDNGATTAVSPTTITVAPNDKIGALPTDPEKTGNTFGGWYTDVTNDSTKVTSDSTFTSDTTVNAKWTENITVKYDANGKGNSYSEQDHVGKPTDTYSDPTAPTDSNYTFVGWNTEKNGSGTYVKAADYATYQAVSEIFNPAKTDITLYAQWAVVSDPSPIPGGDPATPDSDGVKVEFNSNASGAQSGETVVDANPKYKYPKEGDTIGTDNMPNEPTRTNYTFAGWYTNPMGTGTPVTGDTTIDEAGLGTGVIVDNNGEKSVTLYAKWNVPENMAEYKVTLTFNSNLTGHYTAGEDVKVELIKGDSLGYTPAAPAGKADGYTFVNWYTTTLDGDKIKFTGNNNAFSATEPVNADATYYAQWERLLIAEVQGTSVDDEGHSYAGQVYTGSVITPTYKFYNAIVTDPQADPTKGDEVSIDASGYTATYTSGSSTTLKDVGTYSIDLTLNEDSDLALMGTTIGYYNPESYEIKAAKVTVLVDSDTQTQKAGQAVAADVSVSGFLGTDSQTPSSMYTVKYYKWTDTNTDNNIDDQGELAETTISNTSDIGNYVIKVTLNTSNYVINAVKDSKDADNKTVRRYSTAQASASDKYPSYTAGVLGQDIAFEIIANNPSISAVTVKPVVGSTEGNALDLKDSDYKNTVSFDSAEEPTTTEYYVRVDKDTTSAKFDITLTNPDTTEVYYPTDTKLTANNDGTYTISVPLTSSGTTTNDVVITTKAGDNTIAYTFHIQKLVEAKIELNYGNSPYGLIAAMGKDETNPWDSTKIEAAQTSFTSGSSSNANKFTDSSLTPTGAKSNITYTLAAWGNSTDPTVNMDRNEYAIFAYNNNNFTDTGFTAYDSLGNKIDDENVTRSITINQMKSKAVASMNTDALTAKTFDDLGISVDENTQVKTSTNTITELKSTTICPGVYTMTYSFKDPTTGETVTAERKIVYLWNIGDVDLSGSVATPDATAISKILSGKIAFGGIDSSVEKLYKFRIADVDMSTAIATPDGSAVRKLLGGKINSPEFYK
jgi:uncharacterized repeat protein (TIGR02543 family)